jgi:hypothetical protein
MANSSSILGHVAVPQDFGHRGLISCKPPQIGLLRGGTETAGWFGCPIAIEQFSQMPAAPQNGSDNGEQSGKAVLPGMREGQIADQQVSQQSGPDLPLNRIGIMTKKVGQLNGLLDLLEKHFDIPSAPVEFRHGPALFLKPYGTTVFKTDYVNPFPVPATIPPNLAAKIEGKVNCIPAAKKVAPSADTLAFESEIDQLVYKLYGLSPDEIAIVEACVTNIAAKSEEVDTEEDEVVVSEPKKKPAKKRKATLPPSLPGWD